MSLALPPPRDPSGPYRVCLVCLGNICRSPMAEVVLRAEVGKAGLDVVVDSAGTGDWHVGAPMYARARAELTRRGYDGTAHRARQFDASWLPGRDLVLAMDASNLASLRRLAAPAGATDRVLLYGDAGGLAGADIPDPYGGDATEFAQVLDMLEAASPRIVSQLSVLLDGQRK
jgi:protein-tyrosine phosphatase